MIAAFTVAIGFGSFLLFLVEPLYGRLLLPRLGGSPAVWTTALMFFQLALLMGYGYAHWITTHFKTRSQILIHALLVGTAAFALPIAIPAAWTVPPEGNPVGPLLWVMLRTVGLPFAILSATSPLLQHWYGSGDRRDPYFLYAASNAGSLGALLAYPLLVEPFVTLGMQAGLWGLGYWVAAGLVGGCGIMALRSGEKAGDTTNGKAGNGGPIPRVTLIRWIVLALIPSSMMQGVTTFLSAELAPMPLLWVAPLAIYLLSFIIAFGRDSGLDATWWERVVPLILAPLAMMISTRVTEPFSLLMPLHLMGLFVVSVAAHARLAALRPPASGLTRFYFCLSIGGLLGGIFNALIAPMLFNSVAEYPIVMVLACLLPVIAGGDAQKNRILKSDVSTALVVGAGAMVLALGAQALGIGDNPASLGVVYGVPALACFFLSRRAWRFALCLAALLWAGKWNPLERGTVLFAERSFFGVSKVVLDSSKSHHRLFHGNTLHGLQSTDPARKREALTYYHRTGPIGEVFKTLAAAGAGEIAAVGEGAGSIAVYLAPGQKMVFYEIDPVVDAIARKPQFFSFIHDSPGKVTTVLGDARKSLALETKARFSLMVLDAYSSDAVPVHLITREALRLYLDRLTPGGVLAFHISNRHFNLEPVLADLAKDAGLVAYLNDDGETTAEENAQGKAPSMWLVMAREPSSLEPLLINKAWVLARGSGGARVWTDDYASLVRVLTWR